jgi:anti-anti-sigma factor
MNLTLSYEDGYVLAVTEGRIDDPAGLVFRDRLWAVVEKAGTAVVLDLSQSPHMTSHGLGHLVSLAAHANSNSSRVILAACSPFVSIVLSRSRLDRFFETADSVPAAVQRIIEERQPAAGEA